MRRAIVVALVAAVAGCKTTSIYTKGPPTRVVVDKQVSEPVQLAVAVRDGTGRVVVHVLSLQEVRATRRTRHASLETRTMHPGHPWYELLEIPLGAVIGGVMPALLFLDFSGSDIPHPGAKVEPMRAFLIALDPTRALFAGKRKVFVSRDVTFDSPAEVRQYNVRLPIPEQRVRYRLLDSGRDVVSEAEVTTDAFGRFEVPFVSGDVVGIEVVGDAWTTVAPIDGPVPPEPAADVRVPALRVGGGNRACAAP